MADVYTAFEVIEDRNGNEHFIYAAMLDWKDKIRYFMKKLDHPDILAYDILKPKVNHDGSISRTYSDEGYEAILEMIYLAVNKKETKEEIRRWLDLRTARQIIDVFLDVSHYKRTGSSEQEQEPEWNRLIAFLIQETSLTLQDIKQMSIPEIEATIEGINKNNKQQETKEQLTGVDAIQALQKMKGKF